MSHAATEQQREQAAAQGFRSNTERDATIARLEQELAEVRRQMRTLLANRPYDGTRNSE